MSKKVQISKNLELTQKLLKYLVKGKDVPELPQDVSFVPFSNTDKRLNKANKELLDSLSKEDKPVVMAEEPKSAKDSWKLTPINY